MRRGPQTAIALAFLGVLLSFIGSTAYTQLRVAQIDTAADDITHDAAPSVRYLAEARGELQSLQLALDHYVDAAEGGTPDPAEVRRVKGTVDWSIDQYLGLPAFSEEQALSAQVASERRLMDGAIDAILDRGAAHQPGARALMEQRLRPSVERIRDTLSKLIEFNADHASDMAQEIKAVRSQTTALAYLLDLGILVLGGVGFVIALRAYRRYGALLESNSRIMERRVQELELFAGRVAHDVMSPLQPVSLFLHLVERDLADNPEVARLLGSAQRGLQRTKAIVTDLLEFARAGARPAPDARSPVAEVLQELLAALAPDAAARGVELDPSAVDPRWAAACSRGVLTSIVQNLVGNAIKYIGDAKVRRISVRAEANEARVRLEVEDTGPGIPTGMGEELFQPYVRGPGETQSGIGLGLATVKRLAEAHGGAVGVRSRQGKGSLFWVELPRADNQPAVHAPSGQPPLPH